MKSEYTILFQILNQWNFHFHLAYPKTPLYVVEGLPRQKGLDCGYWSLFYTFIVFLTPESLDMISDLKESLNDKFEIFKSFIKSCLKDSHQIMMKLSENND